MIKLFIKKTGCSLLFFFCVCISYSQVQPDKSHNFKGPVVYINLLLPSADTLLLVDGTAAMYSKEFSNKVDEYDAGKLPNFKENICLSRGGENLAIEARKIPLLTNDTLFVKLWGLGKKTYNLQIYTDNLSKLYASGAWLNDEYLHTQIPLSVNNKTFYSFNVDASSNSFANRFIIVFKPRKFIAKPVSVARVDSESKVQIFPNPVNGNTVKLRFFNMKAGNYSVKFTNFSGEILLDNSISHNGGNNIYYIQLNNVYSPGVYSITITNKSLGNTIHLPVIIN